MAIALQPNSVYAYVNLDEQQVFISTGNLNNRGDWSIAAFYSVGDVITYLDALYYCVAQHSGTAPDGNLSDYWSALVLVRAGTGTSSVTAQEAYTLALQAYTIAINGTSSIEAAEQLAIQAYYLAINGTNAANAAYALAIAGTTAANAVYNLAITGTATANTALSNASNALSLAQSAYTIVTSGTDRLDDRIDAEIQARLHGDGTTYWAGTAYTDAAVAGIVSGNSGSAYAYSLYLAGTNYTNSLFETVVSPDYGNRLVSGGRVVWLEDYDFRVAPSIVSFAGTSVNFTGTDVALASPDAVLDRIDLIVADSNFGTYAVVQGNNSTPPVPPDYNPVDQFQITFIPVRAASTQPVVSREWIYREDAEWTTSDSGATINPASTNNPFQGSLDVEGTNVINNNFVRFQRSTSLDVTNFDLVYLYIRPKASWGTSRSFRFNWETAAGARVGDYYTVRHNVLGWDSASQTYQLVAIPISMFNIPAGQLVQALRITVIGSGTAPGFYIDDIALQSGITQPSDLALPLATTTVKGIVELAQNGESGSNVVVQGDDYRLAVALAGTNAANNAMAVATSAYNLAVTGTNATNTVRQNGSQYSYMLYTAGTAYAQSLVGGGGGDHVVAGQNVAITELGAGTKSIAVNQVTTNTVDWVGPSVGAIRTAAYAGTVNVDFGTSAYTTISLTGNLHLTFSNMSQGRGVSVRLIGDSSDRTLGFQGGIRFLGTPPTSLAANKVAVASFCAYGVSVSDVIAAYAAES